MYATVRRYEGIDKVRSEEVARKVGESLVPSLSKLPGFGGYCLIDAGEGVFTSIGLFENSNEAHESTHIAARWVREQKLESALPNTPKVTAGPVIAHESRGAAGHERRPGARLGLRGHRHKRRPQVRDR
jgi:hypothetical protein